MRCHTALRRWGSVAHANARWNLFQAHCEAASSYDLNLPFAVLLSAAVALSRIAELVFIGEGAGGTHFVCLRLQ